MFAAAVGFEASRLDGKGEAASGADDTDFVNVLHFAASSASGQPQGCRKPTYTPCLEFDAGLFTAFSVELRLKSASL